MVFPTMPLPRTAIFMISPVFDWVVLLWQSVSRKALAGVDFINKDTGLHARICIHDLLCLVGVGVEYSHSFDVAPIRNGTDHRQEAVGSELKIAPPVFPDDFVDSGLVPLWSGAQEHKTIGLGGSQPLLHEFVRDHRGKSIACFAPVSQYFVNAISMSKF
jgi:hypothetical protein